MILCRCSTDRIDNILLYLCFGQLACQVEDLAEVCCLPLLVDGLGEAWDLEDLVGVLAQEEAWEVQCLPWSQEVDLEEVWVLQGADQAAPHGQDRALRGLAGHGNDQHLMPFSASASLTILDMIFVVCLYSEGLIEYPGEPTIYKSSSPIRIHLHFLGWAHPGLSTAESCL